MIINVVGDVTGFGLTLEELYKQLPAGQFWGVGDIIDRGPNSKMALDFFINGGHYSVMGNHDHMMLFEKIKDDPNVQWNLYDKGIWGWNGGEQTAESFGLAGLHQWNVADYDTYYKFVENMPLIHNEGKLQITHAPLNNKKEKKLLDLKEINKDYITLERSILWNRYPPTEQEGKFQVYGHNSPKGVLWHTAKNPQGIYMSDKLEVPEGAWAVCIDTWREGYLTALTIDTDLLDDPQKAIKVTQQTIIDPGDWQPKKKVKQKSGYLW